MHAELYTLPDYTPGPPPLRAETEVSRFCPTVRLPDSISRFCNKSDSFPLFFSGYGSLNIYCVRLAQVYCQLYNNYGSNITP